MRSGGGLCPSHVGSGGLSSGRSSKLFAERQFYDIRVREKSRCPIFMRVNRANRLQTQVWSNSSSEFIVESVDGPASTFVDDGLKATLNDDVKNVVWHG